MFVGNCPARPRYGIAVSIESTRDGGVGQQDLESYRAATTELRWYEDTLKKPELISSDVDRLTREKKALEEMMQQSFGP